MSDAPVLIRLHADDEVAICRRRLQAGEELDEEAYAGPVVEAVPAGHKLALRAIATGETIRKYGQLIGYASQDIAAGSHVHVHNCRLGELPAASAICTQVPPALPPRHGDSFLGYRRADGRVGTRNYLAVISSVNCSASVSSFICKEFPRDWLADYPNCDGIIPLTHKGGCAIQHGGEEHQMLTRTLAGFARHPNIGGYLLVGLGCETAGLTHLISTGGLSGADMPVLSIQDQGGTRATVDAGVRALGELLPRVAAAQRQLVPASELCIGLECGGSDAYSGISANPLIGAAADRLIAAGGTAILAETPEIVGAEHLLTRRAVSPAVAEALLERIAWWRRYVAFFGVEIDNNPTAGNKAGGLTTIAEKSLGAVAKAGSSALQAVYRYAEPVTARGLVFMDSPGFDPTSITGMVAGGAQLILFSTGRGSCFGCKPAPSLKICSNSETFRRLPDDMDVDAGRLLDGADLNQLGEELYQRVLAIASGEPTASERHGLGEEEFSPWSIGPVL